MTFEIRDFLHLAGLALTGIVMLVRLDSASKEQTKQHAELKTTMQGMAADIKSLDRYSSSHEARIDGVEERVDRVEARVDLIARRA